MEIDFHEVIDAAATKPFGFMAFRSGPGLGGHCIPVDPFCLTWKAREFGQNTRFIELAGEINTGMPDYVISKVAYVLNEEGKSIKGSKILVLGLPYKANVDDCSEFPSFVLMEKLETKGATVQHHDKYLPVIPPTSELSHFTGKNQLLLKIITLLYYFLRIIRNTKRLILLASNHLWLTQGFVFK